MIVSDSIYFQIADIAHREPHDLSYLWDWVQSPIVGYIPQHKIESFLEKREAFFEVLERLMIDGKLKLEKGGEFLLGTISEQISLFKEAFPSSEESALKEGGMFVWFVLEKCPAYAVWVYHDSNGRIRYEWTQ